MSTVRASQYTRIWDRGGKSRVAAETAEAELDDESRSGPISVKSRRPALSFLLGLAFFFRTLDSNSKSRKIYRFRSVATLQKVRRRLRMAFDDASNGIRT
ncbi:UNVERIFIED_CONTAM: hypothetical protein PYX00_001528 [Menopon gallinae]|uniref:Uncharacterized protein n=1 Tax=Menopon gallinae TaxID=328185 RepID=A0AAW2ID63_9NEOP